MKQELMPETAASDEQLKKWITAGYVMAILGGLIGVFIGQYLAGYQKTLSNGERVLAHSDEVRRHGRYILTLGTIVFVVLACLKLGKVI